MYLRYMVYNKTINFRWNALMKKLDLAMSWKGGSPALFARNVQSNGDYATVCFIIGSRQGELDCGKYLINLTSDFKSQDALDQVKKFLLNINSSIEFANDHPNSSFLNLDAVLNKASELYKLMNFEKKLILENIEQLHLIYLSALRNNKSPELPKEFEYQANSGDLYPIHQVYSAVCALI